MALAGLHAVDGILADAGHQRQPRPVPEFRDLFNGRDLTGWVNVNTAKDTWQVQDGMIKGAVPAPEKYIDLSYLRQAQKELGL